MSPEKVEFTQSIDAVKTKFGDDMELNEDGQLEARLEKIVSVVRPAVLIGAAAVQGAFSDDVLKALNKVWVGPE